MLMTVGGRVGVEGTRLALWRAVTATEAPLMRTFFSQFRLTLALPLIDAMRQAATNALALMMDRGRCLCPCLSSYLCLCL
jgi:hypothetical protein